MSSLPPSLLQPSNTAADHSTQAHACPHQTPWWVPPITTPLSSKTTKTTETPSSNQVRRWARTHIRTHPPTNLKTQAGKHPTVRLTIATPAGSQQVTQQHP